MAGFALHSSESSSSSQTTWTIPGKTLPAGTLYVAVGWYRSAGSAQRTLNSIAHTAITSAAVVTTDDNQTARLFFDDPDRVVGLELWKVESDGGTGDLVLTFSASVWSPAIAIYTASDVDTALTLATGTQSGSQGDGKSVSATASDGSAQFGLAFAYASVTNDTATLSSSPWSTGLVALAPSSYRRFAAVADNATTGAAQSFSVSPGTAGTIDAGAAMEVLFGAVVTADAVATADAVGFATDGGPVVAGGAALAAAVAGAAAEGRGIIAAQIAMTAAAAAASSTADSPVSASAAMGAGAATASSLAGQDIVSWPGSLPDPLVEGLVRDQIPYPLSFAPERGPAIRHRRAAGMSERRRQQHLLDSTQRQTMLDFWKSTGYGRDPFTLNDPLGGTVTARFVGGITDERRKDDLWRVGYELELLWW